MNQVGTRTSLYCNQMLGLFRGRNSVVKRNQWVLASTNCIISGKLVGSLNESQDDSVDSGKGVLSEYP